MNYCVYPDCMMGSGICTNGCNEKESKMSSGKAFSRMFIRSEFVGKNCYKPDLDGWTNYEKTDEREEYLSMKEHSALIAEKNKEIERLRNFIVKVRRSSTCPATVLVAGQVLDGHDVAKEALAGAHITNHNL